MTFYSNSLFKATLLLCLQGNHQSLSRYVIKKKQNKRTPHSLHVERTSSLKKGYKGNGNSDTDKDVDGCLYTAIAPGASSLLFFKLPCPFSNPCLTPQARHGFMAHDPGQSQKSIFKQHEKAIPKNIAPHRGPNHF